MKDETKALVAFFIFLSSLASMDARADVGIDTICEDGYTYKVFQLPQNPTAIQVISEDGTPEICGERLIAHRARYKKLMDLQLEAFKRLTDTTLKVN